ncbi:RnfABCDGE type electron transport complex subunit G [Neofamilia massiliensis]|uniref:RnfABCDGE type electron transport complex subunit G n=1 Tax=Neofamilia massiliensis TaxID=1673724 RepID=UPI0006BB7F31|nr:RnfABCDGE type electron transport complex subunit G [Neofamilia massiliensis]
MKEYLRLGLTLLIIAAIAAGALALLNSVTAPVIDENAKQASYAKYYEVLGEGVEINELDPEELASIQNDHPKILSVLDYKKDGEVAGYIFTTTSNGYGGAMENAIMINVDGSIAGYRNLSNGETPGFGAAISEESYYNRFDGKSVADADSLVLGTGSDNAIEAISGATISSNAVLDGLNEAVAAFKANYQN